MPLYLVSYDTGEHDPREYQALRDFLKSRRAQPLLHSQWIVPETGFGPEQRLYDLILPLLRAGDGLLITEILRSAHGNNLRITDAEFVQLLQQARNV
jgi:hypothetical protein